MEEVRAAVAALGGDLTSVDSAALDSSSSMSEAAAANSEAAASYGDVGAEAAQASAAVEDAAAATEEYANTANEAESASGSFGSSVQGLGGDLASLKGEITSLSVVVASVDMASEFIDDEASVIRVETALRSLGTVTEAEIARTMDLVHARMALGFADDDLRGGYMRLLIATNDYKEALGQMALTADVARGGEMSFAAAGKLVGQVHEGNFRALRQWGIVLDDNATKTEALAALQERFAGQAQAFADSHAGAAARMTNSAGELKEAFGGGLIGQLDEYNANIEILTGKNNDAASSMGSLEEAVEFLGAGLVDAVLGPGDDFVDLAARMQKASAEAAAQLPEDFSAATAGFADIPAGMRLVVEEGEYVLLDMEGNIVASGERIKDYATDAGMGYTNNFVSELEAGQAPVQDAVDANLAAMDVAEAAGELGIDIGSGYSRMEAQGVKDLRPRITAEVNANNAILNAGLSALNSYRAALGQGPKSLTSLGPGGSNAVGALEAAAQGGIGGAQRSPTAQRAAAASARSAFNDAADDIYTGTDELIEDDGLGRSRNAKPAPRTRKAGGRGGGKSADQLLADKQRKAEALERANEKLQDAAEALFVEQPMRKGVADAEDDLTEKRKALTDVTVFYRGEVEKLEAQEKELAGMQKRDTAEDMALLKQKTQALKDRRVVDESVQHSLSLGIRKTRLEIEDLEAANKTALQPLEEGAKRAQKALQDVQKAAAAAGEAATQALWPLQDGMYDLGQAEKKALGPLDDRLQSINDQLYEQAQAEKAQLGPLDEVLKRRQEVLQAAQDEVAATAERHDAILDPLKEELELLRQKEAAHNRLKDMESTGTNIRNLQALLANQGLSEQQRSNLLGQLREAQRQYGVQSKENSLTERIEAGELSKQHDLDAANARVKAAQASVEAAQHERDMVAESLAKRREQLEAERESVSRQRELEERSFAERREAIQAEMDRINRDQELTDRKFHLLELAAQQDADRANQALEDTKAAQEEKLEPLRQELAAQQKIYDQYSFNASEAQRTAQLEIDSIQGRIDKVNDDYNNRRERIKEDIILLQGHQKDAEAAATAEVTAAQGVYNTLKDQYDAWKDANKERDLYKTWLDAVRGKDKALNDLAIAEGNIATKAGDLGAATKDKAAPGIGEMQKAVDNFVDSEEMAKLQKMLDRTEEGTVAWAFANLLDPDKDKGWKKNWNDSMHGMNAGTKIFREYSQQSFDDVHNRGETLFISDVNRWYDNWSTKIGSMQMPGSADSQGPGVPPPPQKALGGRVFGGEPVIVGDGREPELFVPHTDGDIVPFSMLGRLASLSSVSNSRSGSATSVAAVGYRPPDAWRGGGDNFNIALQLPRMTQPSSDWRDWLPAVEAFEKAVVVSRRSRGLPSR